MPENMSENKAIILIVDDEVIIASDLESRLKALGYTVCAKASSGEQALELVEQHQPDLVMMDIVTQGEIDGIDTAEVIRNKWGIPVVFQTAYADSGRLKRAKLAYPFGYLLKPYQDKDLKVTVEMALYVAMVDGERRKAEKSLRRETAWRKMLVHGSRDGIVVLDQTGKVYEANQKFADLLEYELEEVLDLHVWDWDAQWDKGHLLHMIETVDEQGDHFATKHRRKDGTLIDVEISTNGAFQEDEKLVFCVCRDITERKHAEESLRQSEERYRTVLEIAMDGFCLIDPAGHVIQVNDAYCKMTGYTEHELLSMKLNDLESVETEGSTASHMQKIISEGKDRFESRHRRKDGSLFDVEVSVQYSDVHGGLFAAFLRDITEKKRQHDDLQFQSMVLDQIQDHVTATDLNGVILYVNQVVADTLGRSRNDLLGQSTITYGEDPAQGSTQKEIVDKTVRDGSWRGEVVNYSADGSEIIFDCRTRVIHDDLGNPSSLCGISTDITERKRAEEQLRTSEERYRLIANNTTDSIWAMDSELRFTYLSPSTENLFGYTLTEWETLDWGEFVHPEYLDEVQQLFAKIRQRETDNVAAVIRVRRKDRVELWVEFRATAIYGQDDQLSSIVGVSRDITDRKRAEEALKESEVAVRNKLRAILEPEIDLGVLALEDIIDVPAVKSLLEIFHRITGMGSAIVDSNGKVLVGVGWQDICTKFHRCHPETQKNCFESDTVLARGAEPGTFKSYLCKNGMWDMASPIVVSGQHMGNIYLGQFIYSGEEPDVEWFRDQARQFGFDEAEYLAALSRVPRYDQEMVKEVMDFYSRLGEMISSLSFSTISLSRTLTARKRSEEKYETLFREMQDGFAVHEIICDDAGQPVDYLFLDINPAFEQLTGLGRDIIRKTILEVLPNTERHWIETFGKVVLSGEPISFENYSVEINKHFGVTAFRFSPSQFACIFKDITERKRMERQNQVLADIIKRSRDFIGVADLNQNAFFVNPAGQALVGLDSDEGVAKTKIKEYFLPEDLSFVENVILPAVMKDGRWAGEFRFRHFKTGEPVPVLYDLFLAENPETGATTNLATITRDITDRKRTEEALRERTDLLQNITNNMFDMVSITDFTGIFTYVGQSHRILGFEPEEILGTSVFDYVHPDDADNIAGEFAAFIVHPSPEVTQTVEYRQRCKDGSYLWLETMGKFLFNNDGEPYSLFLSSRNVSERKQAEEALRESERRFRSFVENANDMVYALSPEGVFTYMSPNWLDFMGEPAEQTLGKSFEPYVHPEDVHLCRAFLEKTLTTGEKQSSVEYRVRHQDGSWRWHVSNGSPIRDETGTVTGYVGIARDMTEAKRNEEALIQSEKNYRGIFDNSSDCIFIHDAVTGTIVDVNRTTCVTFGYSVEEIKRLNVGDFSLNQPPYTSAEAVEWIRKAHMEGPQRFEWLAKDRKGRLIWFENNLLNAKVGGKARILVFGRNIDDRKHAEKELRKNEELLNQAQEIAQLGSYLWSIGDDGLEWSRQMFSIAGIDPNYFHGNLRETVWNLIHPEDCDDVLEQVRQMVEQKRTWPMEFRLVRPDGDVRWLRSASRFEYDSKGEPVMCIGVHHDITEKKLSEVENEKLQAQLQQAQKMEAIGTLAGGISHDFNNLLQAINGYTQLLIMEKSKTDPEYNSLKAIQDAGFRASDLVRQLLLFSRKADSTRRPIEFQHEVEQAKEILERTIPRMVEIQVNMGNRLWTINADPVQIEQMLLNLGTNAADAMPDGGRLLLEIENVTLDENYTNNHIGAQPGRYVLLTVSDTGEGMDKETVEKIFEPFFTTKEFGKGTGLGLASVYGIVKSHGGYITCYSEVGQGTTFKIYFPAIEEPKVAEAKNGEPQPIPRGTETVLLVDDEESIRGFAQQALMKFGYKVLTASTGEEALLLYTDKPNEIDLIVMDLGMPGMGGHKCLQELLKLNPEVKVVIASGYSINGQVKQSMEAGAKGYVGKPYQLADLLNTVRVVLDEEE